MSDSKVNGTKPHYAETDADVMADYQRLCHAMQSGVAAEHSRGSDDGSAKHLRVGVNTALVDMAALVKLLIAKGVFTEREYLEAIRDGMAAEVQKYETRLTRALGTKVSLG